MPNIRFDKTFTKSVRKFTKNNQSRSQAVKKALHLFQANPKHPSLNTEKLSGADIWSIRVDRGNRLFFVWSETNDLVIFFLAGKHDAYKNM